MARPPGIESIQVRPASSVVQATRCVVGCRRMTFGCDPVEAGFGGRLQVECRARGPGQADELQEHRGAELGHGPARGDELAELVLREQGVGLALGVLEGALPLALELRDAGAQSVGLVELVHGPAGHGRYGIKRRLSGRRGRAAGAAHDTAPGSRCPAERSPSRRARPRRATRARVERGAVATGADGARVRPRGAAGRARDGGLEGRGRGRERVEDGLVADRAATPARQPVGGRAQHRGHASHRRGSAASSARAPASRKAVP